MHDVWLSIRGLYDYDHSIFDGASFPGTLDKQDIVDTILFANAELPLVYTDPSMLKDAISLWSRIQRRSFEKIWDALTQEYNPIHNYDRYEDWQDDGTAVTGVVGYNSSDFTDANKVDTGNKRKGRAYGNIGVTTSAQMIQGEVDVRTANVYAKLIADAFRTEFCIMVY